MRKLVAVIAATLIMPSLARASGYEPLDCSQASSPAEKTVCKTYELGQDEARMATLYDVATSLVAMGRRGNIEDAQRKWIETRDACGSKVSCLKSAYDSRIGELDGVIKIVAGRGPY